MFALKMFFALPLGTLSELTIPREAISVLVPLMGRFMGGFKL